MSKPRYKRKANTYNAAEDPILIQHMILLGWTYMPMRKRNHKGWSEEPFMCFHRQIKNPVIFPKTQKGEISDFQQSQKTLENKGLQEDFPSGAEHTMGVAQSSLAPDSGGELMNTRIKK